MPAFQSGQCNFEECRLTDEYGTFSLLSAPDSMGKAPVVSVIMAVYNGADSVGQAIDCVLQQEFADFELLLADDGSCDGTATRLKGYAAQDPRIRLVTQNNMGLTKSLNRLLRLARGTYIARQDDDDIWPPEKLAKQMAYLELHPEISILGTRYRVIDPAGSIYDAPEKMRISGNTAIQNALDFYNPFMHASIVMHRKQALACGGYDDAYDVAQDYELWLRLRNMGHVDILPDVYCLRKELAGTGLTRKRRRQRRNLLKAKRRHAVFTDMPRIVAGIKDLGVAFLPNGLQSALIAGHRAWRNKCSQKEHCDSARVLVLFLTRGVSLQTWIDRGMFNREKRTYEELLSRGYIDTVLWLTYGTNDLNLASRLTAEGVLHPGIKVLPMPSVFASRPGKIVYSFIAPFFHRRALKAASIFKTNQMDGAWTAWLAKLLWKKPLYLRTGFTLSLFEAQGSPEKTWRIRLFSAIERFLYPKADIAAVSSRQDFDYISQRYAVKNLGILRNYVDTAQFNAANRKAVPGSIVFVGRLHAQKNLDVFIKSLAGTEWQLHLYGDGPQEKTLRRVAACCGVEVAFHGSIANGALPGVLSQASVFALPSLFEGMPKALLEAMACGCLCLGANVRGVNEVIEDGVNGFLASAPTEEGFRTALDRISRSAPETLHEMEHNGVNHIRSTYSLDRVVEQEAGLLQTAGAYHQLCPQGTR